MTGVRVRLSPLLVVVLGLAGVPAAAQQLDPAAVRRALLEGVGPVVGEGTPGPLALFDDRAIPVLAASLREGVLVPVVAASTLGRGRVVAFGHDGYLAQGALANAGLQQLVRNAVRWTGNAARPTVLLVRAGDVAPVLAGVAEVRVHGGEPLTDETLRGVQVVVTVPWTDDWMLSLGAIRRFAEQGGGLVVSGLGWGQLQLNPDLTLALLPLSRLLVDAGIGLGGAAIRQGQQPLTVVVSPLLNGAVAMREMGRSRLAGSDAAAALEAIGNAVELAPPSSTLRAEAAQAAARAWTPQPMQGQPLNQVAQAAVALGYRAMEIAALEPGAHPAASDFPGAVPADAARVTDTVTVGPSGGAWVSTGLYAAPGDQIRAAILPGTPGPRGPVRLRIGAHSDVLYHLASWERAPVLSRHTLLGGRASLMRPPFGGLIYVEREDRGAAPFRVVIEGAVRAPRFVLGRTSLDDWRARGRLAPAPWGELESGSIILTVQSTYLRGLDRPDQVLELWDRVQAANADLAGWAAGESRPMRIVFDRQISAGYMHSGYPIMAPLTAQQAAVEFPAFVRSPQMVDVWGFLHELGHNHQSPDWTFDGTGEVTVNLFTMFAVERALGREVAAAHPEMAPAGRTANLRRYFGQGGGFELWRREPFIALTMYRQVVDAFGWEPVRAVFREYRVLEPSLKQWNDDQRRDQWLMRLSRAVGHDLGPFFAAWGVPVSPEARAAVAGLPGWMPEPDFPARYR